MESRKDMVMFLDGGQLGTLVGKRVSNLSEAVGSTLPEPPEKMVPRGCLSPRAGPAASRERGGGGPEEEPGDGPAGSAAGPGAEPRAAGAAGAAALGPGPPAPSAADSLSGQGQPSSSDTESDFYEEIEVSCTPDCATGNAEYQHSKGSRRPLPGPPAAPPSPSGPEGRKRLPSPRAGWRGAPGAMRPGSLRPRGVSFCALALAGLRVTALLWGVGEEGDESPGLEREGGKMHPNPPEFCGSASTASGRHLPQA